MPPKPPRILIEFQSDNDVRFAAKYSDPPPSEGQLEVVGRELIMLAARLRTIRFGEQVGIHVEKAKESQ
jgi:hypothetical protein